MGTLLKYYRGSFRLIQRTFHASPVSRFNREISARLFDSLKDPKGSSVSVANLLQIIKKAGISQDDMRFADMIQKMQAIKGDDNISSLNLDLPTFTEVTQDKAMVLQRIVQGNLCIPEFRAFTERLSEIYQNCSWNTSGQVASYIPQLAKFSPKNWGMSLCTVDGQRFSLGESTVRFCLESAGKPLNYALALTELGHDTVHTYVGYEPSGLHFNQLALNSKKKPHNPMINSGSIVLCSLIKQNQSPADKFEFIMDEYRKLSGNEPVGFSNSTFLSERATADRNFALGYYMRENNCFPPDVDLMQTLDLYFQLCSVEVTCNSLSVMAATLANGGVCPITEETVLSPVAVRNTLSLMHSCGMYDYSGQFAFECGLPAKSGVSGAILLVVPNLVGFALWSPPLDVSGNSARGIQFCKELVSCYNLHNYDSLIHTQVNKIDPRRHHSEDIS